MANYEKIGSLVIVSECLFYSMLLGDCNCNLKYRWKNLTTNITKTGAEWKSYFVTNPPDCATDDNSLYGTTITGVAGSTITMPPNTGTAFTIAWDNTIMTSGWVQVGTSIDITPSVLAGGEEVKVTYTKP
mgnify:CR=1 FL=1